MEGFKEEAINAINGKHEALAYFNLRSLVRSKLYLNMSMAEIQAELIELAPLYYETPQYDAILDVTDELVGFCSPHRRLV